MLSIWLLAYINIPLQSQNRYLRINLCTDATLPHINRGASVCVLPARTVFPVTSWLHIKMLIYARSTIYMRERCVCAQATYYLCTCERFLDQLQ